ncbi:MAG: Mut7-C RNAse domain-containing protein [Candidatus Binatia bacterium]
MAAPRFAVDKMLGRLATWLRLTGHDATYGSHLSRRTLIREARVDGRTILTRDHRLLRERNRPPLLFIEDDDFRAQLRQVVHAFDLDPFNRLFTRCARCNVPVVPISKAEAAKRVPPYVFTTQAYFVHCPRCQRIYWPATHYEHVRRELQAMGFKPPADAGL